MPRHAVPVVGRGSRAAVTTDLARAGRSEPSRGRGLTGGGRGPADRPASRFVAGSLVRRQARAEELATGSGETAGGVARRARDQGQEIQGH